MAWVQPGDVIPVFHNICGRRTTHDVCRCDVCRGYTSTTPTALETAAEQIGATRSDGDIPGLWNVPGIGEVTTNQVFDIAGRRAAGGGK